MAFYAKITFLTRYRARTRLGPIFVLDENRRTYNRNSKPLFSSLTHWIDQISHIMKV